MANSDIQIIALVGFADDFSHSFLKDCDFEGRQLVHFDNGMMLVQEWESKNLAIVAIISNSEILSNGGLSLIETLKNKKMPSVPFFLVLRYFNPNLRILALTAGISDVFKLPLKIERLEKRVLFYIHNWNLLIKELPFHTRSVYHTGLVKRIFDICFAGLALIILFPLFILVALSIRLESKGPAFYYSLRTGTGFKIFKFYKFRSMYIDADQKVKDLMHLNQYNIDQKKELVNQADPALCEACMQTGKCQYPIYADGAKWCEKDDVYVNSVKNGSAFFKINNDPRITKVGNFIRNTSIDELPQLWNVIKGDMSIVGNRPLPIYEAEKLTTDKSVLRFAAPAGLTGLWQVEKRGKGKMSEEERLMLDNTYAKNQSFINDIKLILRTIPAIFQKESV
ncbi:sugar transferase [Pedobacter sp. R20-19]|uniref:sugar transferase n=1 Tax=Pedobacter sp. R20-19 TaxID=1270196 RepID=UPI00068F1E39|nr:sugar transferase [Pedobacter sp. R20-19]